MALLGVDCVAGCTFEAVAVKTVFVFELADRRFNRCAAFHPAPEVLGCLFIFTFVDRNDLVVFVVVAVVGIAQKLMVLSSQQPWRGDATLTLLFFSSFAFGDAGHGRIVHAVDFVFVLGLLRVAAFGCGYWFDELSGRGGGSRMRAQW